MREVCYKITGKASFEIAKSQGRSFAFLDKTANKTLPLQLIN